MSDEEVRFRIIVKLLDDYPAISVDETIKIAKQLSEFVLKGC